MTLRHGLLSIVVIGLFAGMALAKPGVVRTRDGRTLEGEVTDKGLDGVTIATKLGTISIARDEVAAIDYGTDIKGAYQSRLAALPKTAGAKEHFEIARWLYDAKAFALARQEVNTVLSLDANSAEAVQLRQMIDREAAWEAAGKTGIDTKVPAGAATRPATGVTTVRDRKYLDADQINLIRMAELKKTDRAIRVRFDAGVEKRYTEYNNVDSRNFAALGNFDKALEILEKGTSDMRKDVKILNDPQSMMEFKTRISPMVINGCAAVNCHGGVNAGTFQIFNPADGDAAVYTNFYILTRTAATVTETRRKMIDRTYPQNSLLTQFGLPRERADSRHPEVQGLVPVFKGVGDPRYQTVVDWMKSLVAVEPNYHIDYLPPGAAAPTSQPAVLPVPPQPVPAKQPEPAKQPPAKAPPAKAPPANPGGGNDAQNKLDEIRGRLRPVGIN